MIGLKLIRKKKNLNQLKVAMDLNISREALSYYENGKREPSLELLVAMSQYFNVSINYLITGEEFSKKITPLYKGCDFTNPVKQKINNPIRITYAGNLLFGRLETLEYLAKRIDEINSQESKLFLEIYSGTPIGFKEEKRLNIEGSSKFFGKRQYSEITKILNDTDISLHIESFEESEIDKVRYSFSTKIIDCLQSGSVLMAIGPKGISSIEYPKKIKGTIVIDDLDEVSENLKKILLEKEEFLERAKEIRLFAQEHHSASAVCDKLKTDFYLLFGGK